MTQEKQDRSRDRLLGMDHQLITRRDFLNGIAIGERRFRRSRQTLDIDVAKLA